MTGDVKKVLFATDLTETARHAFYYAASLAARFGAGIVLLHVMENAPGSVREQLKGVFGEEKWRQMQEEHQKSARDILIGKHADYDLVLQALAGLCDDASAERESSSADALELLVTRGHVVEEVLRVAAEKGCDLIVLGAHQGLVRKASVGTVAKGILHGARVPVLVVPPPEAD